MGALAGRKSTIHLHKPDATHPDWYTGHDVASQDEVTWESKTNFYLQFDAGDNPCGPDANGGGANTYNAKSDGNNPPRYIAKCTVTSPAATKPWVYQAFPVPPPPPSTPSKGRKPSKPRILNVRPCNGCLLDDGS
jgi:hypothetical protein